MLVDAYTSKKLTENVCLLIFADRKIQALGQCHPKKQRQQLEKVFCKLEMGKSLHETEVGS